MTENFNHCHSFSCFIELSRHVLSSPLTVVFLIQPSIENTQFHRWEKITFCSVKPSAENRHSGIYFSTSTVAGAAGDSSCPMLAGCQYQCWEQEFILVLSHRKRSTKKKALNKPPIFNEELTDVIDSISLLGLSSSRWIRQVASFCFGKGIPVYRIKKYIDRCFSDTFNTVI